MFGELAEGRSADTNAEAAGMLLKAFIERGEPARAVGFMENGSPEFLEGAKSRNEAVLSYNHARALEMTGDRTQAREVLWDAVEAGVTSPLVLSRLTELYQAEVASADPAADPTGACAWFDQLIGRGEAAAAAEGLEGVLGNRHLIETSAYDRCLLTLLHYLAEMEVERALFDKRWRPLLAPARAPDSVRGIARALAWAYGPGRLRVTDADKPGKAGKFNPNFLPGAWSGPVEQMSRLGDRHGVRREAEQNFRELLLFAEDELVDEGQWREAFVRYYIVWERSPKNTAAATEAANILLVYSSEIAGGEAFLSRMIERIFGMKGETYLGKDWPAILRFHITLATIFSKQQAWGPPHSARSAIFQWRNAIRAHRRVHGDRPAPRLSARLQEAEENYRR